MSKQIAREIYIPEYAKPLLTVDFVVKFLKPELRTWSLGD